LKEDTTDVSVGNGGMRDTKGNRHPDIRLSAVRTFVGMTNRVDQKEINLSVAEVPMKGTGSLVDQLEELVTDLRNLGERLADTAQDMQLAQSFHPQGIAAELGDSRKSLLELCGRLGEMERFISPPGEAAAAPPDVPPPPGPQTVVSLRPAPAAPANDALEKKLEQAGARLTDLAQLVERALRAENASGAARNLGDLALRYHREKKYEEAEKVYRHSLAFREKFFGPEHLLVATGLNNLGMLYRDQERYAEAATLLRRSLAITERAWGANHPNVARRLCNLARVYQKQEKYAEAKPLFERSLAISERNQRAISSEVIASLKRYVEMLRTMKRDEEAASAEARIQAIRAHRGRETQTDSGVELETS
ncbi:MAG: tetratricopeptide repeat protein, partial [Terriglobia bacterium]